MSPQGRFCRGKPPVASPKCSPASIIALSLKHPERRDSQRRPSTGLPASQPSQVRNRIGVIRLICPSFVRSLAIQSRRQSSQTFGVRGIRTKAKPLVDVPVYHLRHTPAVFRQREIPQPDRLSRQTRGPTAKRHQQVRRFLFYEVASMTPSPNPNCHRLAVKIAFTLSAFGGSVAC